MSDATRAYAAILALPVGVIGVRLHDAALVGLDFLPTDTHAVAPRYEVARRVLGELQAYLADPRHVWKVAPSLTGTPFRQRVWRLVQTIPPGQTRTYGELARELGSSARAVGQAVGDNPIPIVIPCHRVIAANGGLGGFNHSRSGYSLDIKRWLLGHEGVL